MYRTMLGVVAVIVLACPSMSWAQLVGDDVESNAQAPWNTLSAGTISGRAPGNLVRDARQQYSELHGDSIARTIDGPVISEEPPEITTGDQVKIEILNTLFENVNTLLVALEAAIRAGGGLTPDDPGNGNGGGMGDLTDLLGTISGPG